VDAMLELNFNLRTVQLLGYSIGVIFTVEIRKGEPDTVYIYMNRHTRVHAHIHVLCISGNDLYTSPIYTQCTLVQILRKCVLFMCTNHDLIFVFFCFAIGNGSLLWIILQGQRLTCKVQCRHHLGRFILLSLPVLLS
jgi:hypothetical protein